MNKASHSLGSEHEVRWPFKENETSKNKEPVEDIRNHNFRSVKITTLWFDAVVILNFLISIYCIEFALHFYVFICLFFGVTVTIFIILYLFITSNQLLKTSGKLMCLSEFRKFSHPLILRSTTINQYFKTVFSLIICVGRNWITRRLVVTLRFYSAFETNPWFVSIFLEVCN